MATTRKAKKTRETEGWDSSTQGDIQGSEGRSVAIIGLGGIGSWLCQAVAPMLAFSGEDWALKLCDGDKYTSSNLGRQSFDSREVGQNKADVQARWVMKTFLTVKVDSFPKYITDTDPSPLPTDYVLLAVDNHRTRNLANYWCRSLKDVVLISGGNELTDGNVQVYIKRDGEDVTPDLCAYHPEIETPADKAPFEMSCEERAKSEPQVLATNLMAASLMLNAFWRLTKADFTPSFNEVYFDIVQNEATARWRELKCG